jgi:mevalonate kinase
MVTASAPGKVILFGEHAVVYGEPAIAGAINKRIYVTTEKRPDGELNISSAHELKDGYPYVRKAVGLTFEYLGKECGVDIKIDSEFPPASGLGSSAAVSVATIVSLSTLLDEKIEKKDVARLGHIVEKKVQGAASITDSSVTTFGGVLFIKPKLEIAEEVRVGRIPLVVGYTGKGGSTKDLVNNVRAKKEDYPDIFDPILHSIGRITVKARGALEAEGNLGELMNINHGLLEALGVGTEKLSRYVHAARRAGASGAKITGAGGGGCMVAYVPRDQADVAKAIEVEGGLALEVEIESHGVRIESK